MEAGKPGLAGQLHAGPCTDLGVQAQGPPGLQKGGELDSSPGQALLGVTGTPGPSLPDLLRKCHPLLRKGHF